MNDETKSAFAKVRAALEYAHEDDGCPSCFNRETVNGCPAFGILAALERRVEVLEDVVELARTWHRIATPCDPEAWAQAGHRLWAALDALDGDGKEGA
jgi:hypothetical protein